MNNSRNNKGFTLLELIIVMFIISILASIAIPSYNSYILKSHRTEGINTLNSIQLEQEKYRSSNTTYGTLANVWNGVTATPNNYYTLAITNPTATSYTVTATAQGNQANDAQNGNSCSVLTLTVNGITTTQTPVACWTQ